MSGCCTKGESCTFSHNWKDKPDMVCYNIKHLNGRGVSANGSECRRKPHPFYLIGFTHNIIPIVCVCVCVCVYVCTLSVL